MAIRILLIEDSHTQALRTRIDLEQYGFEVHVAYTGSGGLRIARAMHLDLILLDLDLPHMSGYEVCRLLKQDQRTRAIPVVMLTHHTDAERRRQSIAAGAIAHVVKGDQAIPTILRLFQTLASAPGGAARSHFVAPALTGRPLSAAQPPRLAPPVERQRPQPPAAAKPAPRGAPPLPGLLHLDSEAAVARLLATTLRIEPPTLRPLQLPADRTASPLGAYLLSYGYLSSRQLINALREQQEAIADRQPIMLGDLLIAQQLISPLVLATLTAVQLFDRLTGTLPFRPALLGEQLVVQGKLMPTQLARAIQHQAWLRSQGRQVLLGAILVQQKLVTVRDIEAVLGTDARR